MLLSTQACGDVTTGGSGDAPTIASVSPDRAALAGDVSVTLTGTGFVAGGENHVVVGDRAVDEVDASDESTLTFELPPGPAEGASVDVLVFNRNGVAVAVDAITYNPVPIVAEISVDRASSAGGVPAVVTGRGFLDFEAGDVSVSIGSALVEGVTVVSDRELQFDVPPRSIDDAAFEALDVAITTSNGTAVLAGAFSYVGPGFLAVNSRQRPAVFFIDPVTFEARRVTSMIDQARGLVLADDDRLHALVGSSGTKTLVVIDPLTGTATPVGSVGQSATSMTSNGGAYFALGRRNDRFFRIDPATGAGTLLGTPGVEATAALAARDDTSVFAVRTLDGPLRIVDTTTGAGADSTVLLGPPRKAHGALRTGDDELLVIGHDQSNSSSSIYRVTISTGAVELLADLGHNLNSLARTPASFE